MNHTVIYKIILLIMCIPVAFTIHSKDIEIEGVWKLVSAYHKYEGDSARKVIPLGDNMRSYKILADGHYAVLTQDSTRNVFGANMGTYSINGNQYNENFLIHKDIQNINDSASFTFKLIDGKWSIYSADIVEVWERAVLP